MADLKAYSKCKEGVERMDYAEQYDLGKFFAKAWQTILRKKDWTPEERESFGVLTSGQSWKDIRGFCTLQNGIPTTLPTTHSLRCPEKT